MGPRTRRAVTILVTSAAVVGALGALAHGDASGKPPAPVFPEDATVARPPYPPGEEPVAVPEPFMVPARTGPCAGGGSTFDNPVLVYRICVPAGWGFSDMEHPGALDEIPSEMLEGLHLISDPARATGRAPFTDIARGRLVDIELSIADTALRFPKGCAPLDGPCEQLLNDLGLPAVVGPIRTITLVLPLAQPPLRLHPLHDPAGSNLLVTVRAARTDAEGVEQAWRIVGSIVAY